MTRRLLCAGLIALGLMAGVVRPARAQSAADLLARGVRATHELEFDSAASWLRQAIARPAPAALEGADRSRALWYLGATEFFRDRRDSAVAVFRRLIVADPRYRPDVIAFPPEVTSLFNEARLGTRAAAVAVPTHTEIAAAGDRLAVRLYGSSLHDVAVVIARYFGGSGGLAIRTLYNGALGDSLEVLWDGRDSLGVPADSGQYVLRVTSRDAGGRPTSTVEVLLQVSNTRRDTLPMPPPIAPSQLRPEATRSGGGGRALLVGLVTAGAAVALPSLIAPDAEASSARYGVAVVAAGAGIVGLLRAGKARPIPENVAHNQQLRTAWQRQADQVHAENEQRRRDARLVIDAGPPRVVEPR